MTEGFEALLVRQIALEEATALNGLIEAQNTLAKNYADGLLQNTSVGQKLINKAFTTGVEAIKNWNVKGGKPSVGRHLIKQLSPEIVTVASLRLMLADLASPEPTLLANLFRHIGEELEIESLIQQVHILAPAYGHLLQSQIKGSFTKDATRIRAKYFYAASSLNADWDTWPQQTKTNVGKDCVQLMLETGLFTIGETPSSRGAPYKTLEPIPELLAYLAEALETVKGYINHPVMLVPPRPWTSMYDGGYYTPALQQRSAMMSMRVSSKTHKKWVTSQLGADTAQPVRDAMNKSQSVGYRVNKRVLGVLSKAAADSRGILGLPAHGELTPPIFPLPEGWKAQATPEDLHKLSVWKALMVKYYTTAKTTKGQKVSLVTRLKSLRVVQDEEAIYFPAFIDWRGRLYFRSTLNPQNHDSVKGCLEFAKGKELGKRGLYWLKVHIANCSGYDKHSFDMRAKWTDDNLTYLFNFMEDPLNVQPPAIETAFTLLAALYDLRDALSLKDPTKHVSHIPVAMDATCSGLQHFSAMFNDEVGGMQTNLIPTGSTTKQDIYATVANKANAYVLKSCKDPVVHAYWDKLKFEIPRSMAKRPVMTYVYGAGHQSTVQYVEDDMVSIRLPEVEGYRLSTLAQPVAMSLRKAVAETVPAAAQAMTYLQQIVMHNPEPISWITPVGVPVITWSSKDEVKFVELMSSALKQRIRISTSFHTTEYNRVKAKSGVSPNFVHSLDSAHLCMTINEASAIDILPIHDSFATHAVDIDTLHLALRETFCKKLYTPQRDIVRELLKSAIDIAEANPKFNTPYPSMGKMDVSKVVNSPYMFC